MITARCKDVEQRIRYTMHKYGCSTGLCFFTRGIGYMMRTMSALSTYPSLPEESTPVSLDNAGIYLKELRRARKLSQSDLAEIVAVGRGTIERLEHGDDRVGVGTVFQVLKFLGASPWYYYDLATHPQRTLN